MEEQRVFHMIEEAVQPLRIKVEQLAKENEQLKMQLFMITNPGKSYKQRQYSKDKMPAVQDRPLSKEQRTSSIKKKEERDRDKQKEKQKPLWGCSRNNAPKSPLMMDRMKHMSPKMPRSNSKEIVTPAKKTTENQPIKQPPIIMGGRKTPKKEQQTPKHSEKTDQSKGISGIQFIENAEEQRSYI